MNRFMVPPANVMPVHVAPVIEPRDQPVLQLHDGIAVHDRLDPQLKHELLPHALDGNARLPLQA